ncbi:cysteine dioxygenase family protein [Nocardia sp. CDC159]|uniref:Cysteine dioxygenase family protein n=1 Tax=Nocardia pulmonis TaxID=2951408 RepID=A0A9X2E6B0_9NOCA|nr:MULTISPECIES: cysteine dioxygenase family protein [Nocardia]MCM6773928.1 cysteine dioxygenase family protein [Nocardia pulmonis]MCM6786815.1 cysteine dioxygenase family protein [Nocardia sp. CDC159]
MPALAASGKVATRNTELLDELIESVRRIVWRGLAPQPTAEMIGRTLEPVLGQPGLLTPEQTEGDPNRYRQHVLHAEHDGSFSIVALVWLPGQQTSIHDHVSWCVAGVHEGQESERRYRLVPDGSSCRLVTAGDVLNPVGAVSAFAPPGDIHRVRNAGDSKAISIHLYGADVSRLGTSIRRVYTAPVGEA